MAGRRVGSERERAAAVREGVTMALYVCIVLAAEFVSLGELEMGKHAVIEVVWGTTLGLALAHVFAFDVASRLTGAGRSSHLARIEVVAQLVAAAGVALVVTAPFLVLGREDAMDVAGFLVAGIIGVAAYGVARASGAGTFRSGVYASLVLLLAVAVVSVKVALSGA